MKRRYQIAREKAVQKFRRFAEEENPSVQLALPMAEVAAVLQEGVGELMRQAGLQLMLLIMETEVRHWAGDRHQPTREGEVWRWGQERGYCVVDGQKVPIRRTRLRERGGRERRLGSYELFQRPATLEQQVWEKLIHGLSTRNYGPLSRQFAEAYGVEKSVVSERFIAASQEKLKALLERPLGSLRLCAILIDATEFKGQQLVVALGIGVDGRKTVLGLREGATENTAVVSALCEDLVGRGLDFSVPRLYVLDGAKALQGAVRRHAGEAALIQRCQIHKKRNVLDHLPEEYRAAVGRKIDNAYAMAEYPEARRALDRLEQELEELNPSAARSLAEGMEETLTVHRLRVPSLLRRTLRSTNAIESTFSLVETACRNVKRWRGGDHRQRWVASGLLLAERKFRRVKGYREIPQVLEAIAAEASQKKGVVKRAGAA